MLTNRRIFAAVLVSLLAGAVAHARRDALQEDLASRRARAMEKLGSNTLAIFWSAPTRVYSMDVDYEYRQESNLLYLTGIHQEDTILVLMPGNRDRKEMLFVSEPDARREHWIGHSLTPEEATAVSGIKTVLPRNQFEDFISSILSPGSMVGGSNQYDTFLKALAEGKANLALLMPPQNLSQPPTREAQFAGKLRERFFGFTVTDATPILNELRQVKTEYEQDVLRRSVKISSDAHRAGMRAAAPGKYEYEVEAEIEAVYLRNGAMSWGYPSIVGSGPNATILHYGKSSRKMENGDLLLVDAAASYQDLTGDITRTYPVNGTYTKEQRDIYEIVYAAQQAGEKAARTGAAPNAIQAACDDVLRAGLVRLGLVTEATGQQFKIWATHGVSHWIGMDVHDVGVRGKALAPGMAFVIEPGIYIRPQALEALKPTPENAAFINKVRPMVEKYKYIGVRIEDSYLLTTSGLERLSATVPRSIEEIETFMKKGTL